MTDTPGACGGDDRQGPALDALLRAADLYPTMTLSCLRTFVYAYWDGGRSNMRAIAAGLGVSYTTVTRHADVLGLYGNETVRSVYGLFEKVDASQCSKGVGLVATERGHEFARELGLVAPPHARKAVRKPRVIAPRESRGRAR